MIYVCFLTNISRGAVFSLKLCLHKRALNMGVRTRVPTGRAVSSSGCNVEYLWSSPSLSPFTPLCMCVGVVGEKANSAQKNDKNWNLKTNVFGRLLVLTRTKIAQV